MADRRKRSSEAPDAATHAPSASRDQAAPAARAIVPAAAETGELGLDDLLPLAIPESGRRGSGRPRGAANIRTNTTFAVAVSRYGDPLIASIAWGNMDTLTLIRELRAIASDAGLKLGATVMDVVRFQEDCRRNAMPFGHAKRAPVDDKGAPVLPIIGIGRVEQINVQQNFASGRSIEDAIDGEQFQGVSADAPDKSHGEKSHDGRNDD